MTSAEAVAVRRSDENPLRWLAIDPRRYRHHVGQFVIARRVTVAGAWTPFVTVRARRPRAADGGTEI